MPTELSPTQALMAHARGDCDAASRFLPVVYDRLRKLAAHHRVLAEHARACRAANRGGGRRLTLHWLLGELSAKGCC